MPAYVELRNEQIAGRRSGYVRQLRGLNGARELQSVALAVDHGHELADEEERR